MRGRVLFFARVTGSAIRYRVCKWCVGYQPHCIASNLSLGSRLWSGTRGGNSWWKLAVVMWRVCVNTEKISSETLPVW